MVQQWRIFLVWSQKRKVLPVPAVGMPFVFCIFFLAQGLSGQGFHARAFNTACPPKFRAQRAYYQLLKTLLETNLALANRIFSYGWHLFRKQADNAVVTLMHYKGIHPEWISAEDNLSVALLIKCPNRLFPHWPFTYLACRVYRCHGDWRARWSNYCQQWRVIRSELNIS